MSHSMIKQSNLFIRLLSNINCIQNFIQLNGIETIQQSILEEDDSDTILELLRIFSTLASQGNEYKIKIIVFIILKLLFII